MTTRLMTRGHPRPATAFGMLDQASDVTGGNDVEQFTFAPEVAFVPRGDVLDRVTVAPLTPSILKGHRSRLLSSASHQAGGSVGLPRPFPRYSPCWKAKGRSPTKTMSRHESSRVTPSSGSKAKITKQRQLPG